MVKELKSIIDCYDHEEDAHRYNNLPACRVCSAEKALAAYQYSIRQPAPDLHDAGIELSGQGEKGDEYASANSYAAECIGDYSPELQQDFDDVRDHFIAGVKYERRQTALLSRQLLRSEQKNKELLEGQQANEETIIDQDRQLLEARERIKNLEKELYFIQSKNAQ